MSSLSPAAQAVLDATGASGTTLEMVTRAIVATALRAAAAEMHDEWGPDHCIDTLRAIANELAPHD